MRSHPAPDSPTLEIARFSRARRWLVALAVWAFASFWNASVVPAADAEAEGDALRCRVRLLGGREVEGRLAAVSAERLELEGEPRAFAYHEIREIRFARALRQAAGATSQNAGRTASDGLPDTPDARAFVVFTGGEILPAKVVGTDGQLLKVIVRGERTDEIPYGEPIGNLKVPLAVLRGFRLREAYKYDDAFEASLAAAPPAADTVFVRQRERLVRVEGTFEGIDGEYVEIEFRGKTRRIQRQRLLGVQFAPVAGTTPAAGYEGRVHLRGGGALPARLVGLQRGEAGRPAALQLSVGGARWQAPLPEVLVMSFSSDRIRFLSDVEPARVEEMTFLGGAFPYRRDLAVTGEPLRLGGEAYSRGLGTHSRSILEYALDGAFASFVARVGIQEPVDDDIDIEGGVAEIRVLADDTELFRATVEQGKPPIDVSLALDGAATLRLETDFGRDGLDFGDHVNWVEARVVKPAKGSPSAVEATAAPGRNSSVENGVDQGERRRETESDKTRTEAGGS